MRSAVLADLIDPQTLFVASAAAFHDVVLLIIPAAAVYGLPALVLSQDVAQFHIAKVGLIDEAVLPDQFHGRAGVLAAVNGHRRFVAAGFLVRIGLEVEFNGVDQHSARRSDRQPVGVGRDRVVDLGVGSAVHH